MIDGRSSPPVIPTPRNPVAWVDRILATIRQKLGDALARLFPSFTRRDALAAAPEGMFAP